MLNCHREGSPEALAARLGRFADFVGRGGGRKPPHFATAIAAEWRRIRP